MRGDWGGCGVSANEYSCTHHVTWSHNKLWRSTSIFNLWFYLFPHHFSYPTWVSPACTSPFLSCRTMQTANTPSPHMLGGCTVYFSRHRTLPNTWACNLWSSLLPMYTYTPTHSMLTIFGFKRLCHEMGKFVPGLLKLNGYFLCVLWLFSKLLWYFNCELFSFFFIWGLEQGF
jgi:hypothetical protein